MILFPRTCQNVLIFYSSIVKLILVWSFWVSFVNTKSVLLKLKFQLHTYTHKIFFLIPLLEERKHKKIFGKSIGTHTNPFYMTNLLLRPTIRPSFLDSVRVKCDTKFNCTLYLIFFSKLTDLLYENFRVRSHPVPRNISPTFPRVVTVSPCY